MRRDKGGAPSDINSFPVPLEGNFKNKLKIDFTSKAAAWSVRPTCLDVNPVGEDQCQGCRAHDDPESDALK